jgi:hypothetical protein
LKSKWDLLHGKISSTFVNPNPNKQYVGEIHLREPLVSTVHDPIQLDGDATGCLKEVAVEVGAAPLKMLKVYWYPTPSHQCLAATPPHHVSIISRIWQLGFVPALQDCIAISNFIWTLLLSPLFESTCFSSTLRFFVRAESASRTVFSYSAIFSTRKRACGP